MNSVKPGLVAAWIRYQTIFKSKIATALLNTADAGLYTLTSVVGEQVGVGEEMLGYILTGAMVAGIVAALPPVGYAPPPAVRGALRSASSSRRA